MHPSRAKHHWGALNVVERDFVVDGTKDTQIPKEEAQLVIRMVELASQYGRTG